jgi:glycolate oxidase iron-sulfur subunit
MPQIEPHDLRTLEDAIDTCVGCGFCLEACPTYRELGHEADSPRGRIALIDALVHETLAPTAEATHHIDLCLGCRACETACPSGVPYGSILEHGRDWLKNQKGRRKSPSDRILEFAFRFIITQPIALFIISLGLSIGHKIGFFKLMLRIPQWPEAIKNLLLLTPKPDGPRYKAQDQRPVGEEKGTSALFLGCVQRYLFPEVHRATAKLLLQSGQRLLHPPLQNCCGALQLHNGYLEEARRLARKNVRGFMEFFNDHPDGQIVINAAGCGSTLKEYGELLKNEPLAAAARRFSRAVKDWSEVVTVEAISLPHEKSAEPPIRVAYQDACHLAHAQKITQQPRDLLAAHPGIELVDLDDEQMCCGSAGVYNLMEQDMAKRLQHRKIEAIERAQVSMVVSSNPGCLLQMQAGLSKSESETTRVTNVVHPTILLANPGIRR